MLKTIFPIFQMLELVRPVLKLLKVENTALENFEALMALTNLAGIGENVRKRILKEDGFANIEYYMYEEHRMLRRAATECMCNLVVEDEVRKVFKIDVLH
jgi:ribosomal protein S13